MTPMPAAPVKPFTSDKEHRTRPRVDAWIPIAIVAALMAIALARPVLEPGPFVTRLTVVNSSEYAFDVDVAGADAHEWTLLGTVAERGDTTVADVYDQGSTWTFRFVTQGVLAGQVEVSRAALERSGWRLVVPDRFAAALRAKAVVPTTPIH
jgi:hypothetical protein